MDHHCRKQFNSEFRVNFIVNRHLFLPNRIAWLNNCVGYANHRYFFMYMLFTVVGSLFIILFGLGIAYELLWLDIEEPEELQGHPIMYNLTVHFVPVVSFGFIISLFVF